MRTYTHKLSGWTRTAIGFGKFTIAPSDDSGARTVAFLSAHSWQNYPNDDRANIDRDRVVLIDGPALPAWAVEWLTKANAKSCQHGRAALSAAIHDADMNDRTWNGDGY